MGSDFNGDGRDDILWRYIDGDYYLTWQGAPNGSFLKPADARQVPSDWRVWGLGDFNGDGRDDVLWRHDGGLVTNWLGRADSGFTNNHINSATLVSQAWTISGTGDFNGDGRDDVLLRHATGRVGGWLGDGPGGFIFNPSLDEVVPNDWFIAGTGDFNGDGHDDILWRHSGGMVTNWLGNADGGFSNNHAQSATLVPNDWQIVGTGNFNGDKYDDVVWQQAGGMVTNWLGTASGGFINNHANSATMPHPASGLRLVATGDYNGDGRDDVLLRNGDGVTNWLATANGGFVDNSGTAFEYLDPFWSVEPNPAGVGQWDY